MRRIVSFLLISLILAGCQTPLEKEYTRHGFTEGIVVPGYPVIFIPGLGYTGEFWEKSDLFKELQRLGWKYGGRHKVIRDKNDPRKFYLNPELLSTGHLYTMTFSDTQLAIIEQGKELAAVVERVKRVNHVDKVILVGHSMGGLAAREYLQSPYYQNDVAGFVSVGTPHQGSNFRLEKISLELVPKIFRDLVWDVDMKTDAVRDLRPASVYLKGGNEQKSPDYFYSKDINLNGFVGDDIVALNNFKARPLPMKDIYYACVIGSGCPFIATRQQAEFSDGIVKIHSADLNDVPGVNVRAEIFTTNKDHFAEVNDSWVLMQTLKPLLVTVD